MKSIKTFLSLSLLSLIAASCGHFVDDPSKSVWSGGLWLIFWIPFLGGLFFSYKAYSIHKKTKEWSTGHIVFAAIAFVATIVIVIAVNADK